MSVRDVIKNSFLNQINTDISTTNVLVVLLATAILGVYLFFIYRMVCKKAFYSKSFAISLVVIALVTSIIIITIQSSVVISLGMVGALSIVRFRTAIKDPMDLAFLFWAISIGIICGANLYEIALEGSLVITFVMLLLYTVPNVQPAHLLLINATDLMAEAEINEILKGSTRYYKVKSRNITSIGIDMIIELKSKDEAELIKNISELEKVESVTLMEHDGEITY
ncbi:MAG: DUF4956 domain-containing protein [Lachnospiraceae bacterium]|nr:DUF4956 domain-containing protein [Lachnospiraceae bacterium]